MMLYQALYRVTIRSYAELQHAFLVHHQVGPTEADIMKHDRVDTRIERPRPPSAPQIPFFIAQLRLLPDRIEVEPLEDILKMIFHRITGLILETVMDIAAFTTDPIFVQYTQWVILCIDCDYVKSIHFQTLDYGTAGGVSVSQCARFGLAAQAG